jgi:hypothetical protein
MTAPATLAQRLHDHADSLPTRSQLRADLYEAARLLRELSAPRCMRPEGCVCGGDTPAVRAGCGYWGRE